MRELWSRLETHFAQHWSSKDLKLRKPATEKQISAAEKSLSIRFPDDFRASLRVHDGQDPEPSILWLPGVPQLGSLESIVNCWTQDRAFYEATEADETDERSRVRQTFHHPRHIAFAGSAHWDYDRLLFDFEPGPEGHAGQIIMRSDVEFLFLVRTFRELMEKTVEGLENGTIATVEKGAPTSRWVTMQYLSPRAKRPVDKFKYFA